MKNFVYPEIKDSDRVFGVSLGEVIREDGDWRDFLPPEEEQKQQGVESSACFVEAQQHSIATIQEEEFDLKDQNYSARFNALLANGTENGGDPIRGAKSMKYDGLIPDEDMSFKGIDSWNEYHSWEGVDEKSLRQKGKEFLDRWKIDFKIVAEKDYPLETKYSELREALKRSPVPVSVFAWRERNGEYYKPQGVRDTHLTMAVYVDEKDRIHVWDSYSPYAKILEAKTDFEFAMALIVKKKPYEEQLNILSKIIALISQLVKKIVEAPKAEEKPPETPILPQPEPLTYSIELLATCIRDYEGYTVGSRAYRNKNPGNCRYSPVGYLPKYGNVGKDPGGFAVFETYDLGFLYLKNLLKDKISKNPNWKLDDLTSWYAPSSDNNNPFLYATYLAKRLGVDKSSFKISQLV